MTRSPQAQEAMEAGGGLVSAPVVESESFGGKVQISGTSTESQAKKLAASLER